MEISDRADSAATDTGDNCRGVCSGCEGVEGAVAGLQVGSRTALLGWQQLESDQPKKMVLAGHHFW